jgi:hypothetical protein
MPRRAGVVLWRIQKKPRPGWHRSERFLPTAQMPSIEESAVRYFSCVRNLLATATSHF